MKLAIDARMYGPEAATGIGQYIQQLITHLLRIDHDTEYVLFMREPAFSTVTFTAPNVTKVKVTPRWYSYAEQFILPFEMAKIPFDLIHYPHFNSPIFFPKPSICTIHDVTPLFYPGHRMTSKIRRLGYHAVFRSTVMKARAVMAVSENTKQQLIKHLNVAESKVKVTHLGVDERFRIITENGILTSATERYGITKPFIFYIGAWRNHKNLPGLITAFNQLRQKTNLDYQLVLGGQEDPHYTAVRQAINESPFKHDIITPGFIDDASVPLLFNAAALYVVPSFVEGFGLIGIEAQACGVPVISTNLGSMPEVLGDSARFFDPHAPEAMFKTMQEVLTHTELQAELKQKGLHNVTRFSWERCAQETLAVYKTVCNEKPKQR